MHLHYTFFSLFFLGIFLLSGCEKDTSANSSTDIPAKAAIEKQSVFTELEASIEGNASPQDFRKKLLANFPLIVDAKTGRVNRPEAEKFISLANRFYEKYPQDTLVALPLYRAAEASRALNDAAQTADLYGKVYENFEHTQRGPEALFMQAFTYDEELDDDEQARIAYEEFIRKFPDHSFADDAAILIKNLGKTTEEIIRELETQQQLGSQ